MLDGQLKQIGRLPRFYDNKPDGYDGMQEIPRHGLEMWPGYIVDPKVYVSGCYINIDTATKFIQTKSVLELLSNLKHREKRTNDEIKDMLLQRQRKVPGFTVITKWGKNLSYQIDDIDFNQNPKTHRFEWTRGQDTKSGSMVDYFRDVYPRNEHNPEIRDMNQPLLVVHKPDRNIYLPPELCFIPNLPTDFTKNFMAMRDIQEYKTVNPQKRFDRISRLGHKIGQNRALEEFEISNSLA